MPKDPTSTGLTIPEETKKKFPELIPLILNSESMNDEERQYWINILPIMTPEQLQNLMEILQNEKKQLEEIDKKYAGSLSKTEQREMIAQTDEKRRQRREEQQKSQKSLEEQDKQKTEAILQQIDTI